jgi:hypothetical protein
MLLNMYEFSSRYATMYSSTVLLKDGGCVQKTTRVDGETHVAFSIRGGPGPLTSVCLITGSLATPSKFLEEAFTKTLYWA